MVDMKKTLHCQSGPPEELPPQPALLRPKLALLQHHFSLFSTTIGFAPLKKHSCRLDRAHPSLIVYHHGPSAAQPALLSPKIGFAPFKIGFAPKTTALFPIKIGFAPIKKTLCHPNHKSQDFAQPGQAPAPHPVPAPRASPNLHPRSALSTNTQHPSPARHRLPLAFFRELKDHQYRGRGSELSAARPSTPKGWV